MLNGSGMNLMKNLNIMSAILKKRVVFFLVAMLTCCISYATVSPTVHFYREKDGMQGGMDGMSVGMKMTSNLSKKEMIQATILFFEDLGLVDRDSVDLDEINENVTEFTVPFYFPVPMYSERKLGMPVVMGPLEIIAELRLEFEGQSFSVSVENMNDRIFQPFFDDEDRGKEEDAVYKFREEEDVTLAAGMTITKFLVFMNAGLEGLSNFKKSAAEYLSDTFSKFEVYDKLVEDNQAGWFNRADYIKWIEGNIKESNSKKWLLAGLQKFEETKRMPNLSESRWEKQVRPTIYYIFMALCGSELNGTIESVAENGETVWANIDGKLLPTDPKLQKKYIKKNWDFFNHD